MTTKKRVRTDLLQRRYTVRLDQATADWVEEQAKSGGYKGGQDFIRELVKRERSGTNDAFLGLEERIAATLVAQTSQIEGMQATGYANFAAVMSLANLFLETLLPPTREARQVLDANHKARLDKFIKALGMDMKGKWANTLQDFAAEMEEEADDE
jgi:Arc/MetJ-type ribon-helix-helix transcriptional regulator